MTEPDTPCVDVTDLRFAYPGGGFALQVPELVVGRGRSLVLTGPSGSGKTTLLKLLAGILEPDSGRIRVLDRELTDCGDGERRRFRIASIGIIFQEFELLDYLTVRENLLLPYLVNPALRRSSESDATVEAIAARLGIEAHLARRPRVLSQGERQRVAIGRALVTSPEILMADEPTGNLDPENTRIMMDLVFEQVASRGATFLMVTHDHGLLERFDRSLDFEDLRGEGSR